MIRSRGDNSEAIQVLHASRRRHIGNVRAGIAEVWCVGQAKSLSTDLDVIPIMKGEALRESEIPVEVFGTAQGVSRSGAKGGSRDRRKSIGIKVGIADTVATENLDGRKDPVGELRVAWGIEGCCRRGDRERRAAGTADEVVELSTSGNIAQYSMRKELLVLTKWQSRVAVELEVVLPIEATQAKVLVVSRKVAHKRRCIGVVAVVIE